MTKLYKILRKITRTFLKNVLHSLMETIYRAYKYRLYPNKEQQTMINKHIGCCRWVYSSSCENPLVFSQGDEAGLLPKTLYNKALHVLSKVYRYLVVTQNYAITKFLSNVKPRRFRKRYSFFKSVSGTDSDLKQKRGEASLS